MKLTDLNADGGIGANCLLLEIGVFKLLVDCGLHPKRSGTEAAPALDRLAGIELDLILLTHCHLDHLGALPLVLRQQPRPPVLMSIPSLHLAERMLHNSVNVMLREREEKGVKGYPLFTHFEVEQGASRFFAQNFGQTRRIHKDGEVLEVTLHPSGHIAGAAGVQLNYRHRRIFLSGDVLFTRQETIPGARFPEDSMDTVVLETTRGATPRDPAKSREAEVDRLLSTVNHILDRGGSVLIPVFALGRMQELLTIFAKARRARTLPEVPFFASGLGMDLVDRFDEIHRKTNLIQFSRSVLKTLKVQKTPKELIPGKPPSKPGVYLLSSGMLVENTPSYRMAACLLGGHEHAVCFVGYCDPDTPGGRLLAADSGSSFLFDKLDYVTPIRAQVEKFDLSGHAEREELVSFALARNPRAIVLTHGDPPARAWFRQEFAARAPEVEVIDPVPLKTHKV